MFASFSIASFLHIWIAIAIVIFPLQIFVSAPYGRHTKSTWGPMLSNQLGWVLMESWALIIFWLVYVEYFTANYYALLFAGFYSLHYIHRSFIFPLRTKTKGKEMPFLIAFFALIFNAINAGCLAYYLSVRSEYPLNYLSQWNFIIGIFLFFAGAFINIKSDDILINLRKPGETDYKIPKCFLFRYISCPNHFGEMLEWLGFMLMLWNLAGVAFFVWTISNLCPRALHHHRWYLQHFADYPKDRKAVFPFIL